jgi:DNA-binding CsgD family transcriptional regulator
MQDSVGLFRDKGSDASDNGSTRATRSAGRPLSLIADEIETILLALGNSGSHNFDPLSEFDECVFLKNADGVCIFSNKAHRRLFTQGDSPIGRNASVFLDPLVASLSVKQDALLFEGCRYVECEHTSPGPDGVLYKMFTHKRSLQSLNAPGLAVLGVMRLEPQSDAVAAVRQLDLATACARFRELSERDQELCRQTALGVSSRELGERLNMTTRGVELRKQKAFTKLGVAKAVDLARLLTRLQDRGYLDLGM